MYSLDTSSCPRLAGTGNRRALSFLLSRYYDAQQRPRCRRRCHPSTPEGNRQRRIPAAGPSAAGSAGRKHRTSQAGVGGSRARYRNVNINRRCASIGVEGRPIRAKNGTNGVSSNTASTQASCSGSRCNSSGRIDSHKDGRSPTSTPWARRDRGHRVHVAVKAPDPGDRHAGTFSGRLVNTTLRTALSVVYVLHRRHRDWMMRSLRRVRLAIAK